MVAISSPDKLFVDCRQTPYRMSFRAQRGTPIP
jgi:hypothetical protein